MSFIILFLQRAIEQSIVLLYGANGEILTEKSGNLNLGVPGLMYMGGICGLLGGFLYEKNVADPSSLIAVIISLLCALIGSGFGALLYAFLTISMRANQNVTGLVLSTFGVGFGNFFGGYLSKMAGGVGQVSATVTAAGFRARIPFLNGLPVVGDLLFGYGFLTYLSLVLTIVLHYVLFHTRVGLTLRAVGENPATADAAGISVGKYKYLATIIGGMMAGLAGLYFVMEFSCGNWANNAFGDRGWLAIALVIFACWRPLNAIWGSLLFGALYILYLYIPGLNRSVQELFKSLPYLITVLVLVLTSLRRRREDQPPAALGKAFFREIRIR